MMEKRASSVQCNLTPNCLPELADAFVVFSLNILLLGVELFASVHELSALGALDTERKHHSHLYLVIFGPAQAWYLGWVKVRREVLVQHFAFTHGA
jgi:hypothetical protein